MSSLSRILRIMIRFQLLSFCLILCVFLNGCALFSDSPHPNSHADLLPLVEPSLGADLDDGYVKRAMSDYLRFKKAPPFSQYDFVRVDLNHDGRLDALVHLTAPYGRWCEARGCSLLVFEAESDGFSLAGQINPVRAPVFIEKEPHSFDETDWKSIVVRVSGTSHKAKNVRLFFDENGYPNDPTMISAMPYFEMQKYTKIFP